MRVLPLRLRARGENICLYAALLVQPDYSISSKSEGYGLCHPNSGTNELPWQTPFQFLDTPIIEGPTVKRPPHHVECPLPTRAHDPQPSSTA